LVVLSADEGYVPVFKAGTEGGVERTGTAVGAGSAVNGAKKELVVSEPLLTVSNQTPESPLMAGEGEGSAKNTDPTIAPFTMSTSTPIPETSVASNTSIPTQTTRPVLIVALQAYLYTVPSSSLSILYISKVDTSGYSTSRLSLTKKLMTTFISYHLDAGRVSNRVQVALFARSQGQYLFPNSVQGGGKRVGGGLKLCGWWKGVYEEVVRCLRAKGGKGERDFHLPMRKRGRKEM
jgi:hypothetical protein